MDDLSDRLEALPRRYAAAMDQGQGAIAKLVDEFRACANWSPNSASRQSTQR
jgi:hypothetical protein